MTTDTQSSKVSEVIVLSVGAVAGIAGTLALIQVVRALQIDVMPSALPLDQALTVQAQAMGLANAESSPAYWYVARTGGILAYLLLWMSVFWGITMSSKLAKGIIPAWLVFGLHQFLPVLAMVFATLHTVVLLGDSYFQFSVWHLLIPFTSPYRPIWTAPGILAFYLLAAILLSAYLRTRIGYKAWRSLHYASYVAFLLALVHGVQSGTDGGTLFMQLTYSVTATLILFATLYRILLVGERRITRQAARS